MAEREIYAADATEARQLSRVEYAGLKTAFFILRGKVGKQRQAAELTRVDQTTLSKYELHGKASDGKVHFAASDVELDLEVVAGDPVVTRYRAELQGYALVQMPRVDNPHAPLGRVSAEALKEVGDVFVTLGEQLGDGTFTAVEDKLLGREIDEAIVKLLQLKAQAHAVVEARAGGGS